MLSLAQWKKESSYRPNITSDAGAMGITQIMYATAKGVGLKQDFYNPRKNINAGTKHMARILKRNGGNLIKGLIEYNSNGVQNQIIPCSSIIIELIVFIGLLDDDVNSVIFSLF